MHIDQEMNERFMHGQLDASTDLTVREHLATCGDCRARFENDVRDEEEVHSWLRQLDHPRPTLSANAVMATPLPARRPWGRWAAAILMLGGAGAAYAFPGSPVPGWAEAVIEQVTSAIADFSAAARGVGPTEPVGTSSPEPPSQTGGLGVPPGSSLIVMFESAQPERTVDVVLYDGDEVRVSASGGIASFTAGDDRLVIGNAGSTAHYEVRIPRNAAHVEIRVSERRVFLKNGVTVTTETVANGDGVWVIELGPGGDSLAPR